MNLWTVFADQPVLFLAFAGLLGLLVGSFINVLAYRLPIMLERQWQREAQEVLGLPVVAHERFDLCLPASRCSHCGHRIRAWENIPVLSYLWLRGRCSACKAAIGVRYPLVELGCAVLSVVLAWQLGPSLQALFALLLTWCLLGLSLIDADHQLLPDVLVMPTLWLGLLCNAFGLFTPLPDALWGAAIGYLSLWAVYWVFKLLTGKEGLGYGDFKLLALIGAWGGWQVLPLTLVLSSVVGAVMGLCLLGLRRASIGSAMPFGPYLAIAGWIAVLWGDEIYLSYMQLFGH
ncbi:MULTISPECIES: prepilin peptidase [Pseudomonas]|uniref:Prepilin leader peptidase/N-methyltransferase n=1 Tax=Pseudomonas putida TaxID=303 RepID=A0A1B2F7V5_PSEPU|nr:MULTISPECIES: A24 family peptidase [Pseudomonas]ANY88342.1 Type 4 prepilin-like protein leader peptide-processing enzyme [Pseudomonas putida]MCL8308043.1 A24 family peptidase [Pseudomonas putida]